VKGWRRRGLPAVLAVGLLGGFDGATEPPAAGAGIRPAAPARSRCRTKACAGAAGAAARAAGRAPSGLLNRLRSRAATLDASTQWTSAGQALRTGSGLGAEASCDGIAFTHLSWAQTIRPGPGSCRGAATGPAGSLVRGSRAVCPAWSVRERHTIERPRSACRPAGPGSARVDTLRATQLARRA